MKKLLILSVLLLVTVFAFGATSGQGVMSSGTVTFVTTNASVYQVDELVVIATSNTLSLVLTQTTNTVNGTSITGGVITVPLVLQYDGVTTDQNVFRLPCSAKAYARELPVVVTLTGVNDAAVTAEARKAFYKVSQTY